ncbi:MAG: hypothetical protein ACM3U1_04305 [Chloroflexota bacterium]
MKAMKTIILAALVILSSALTARAGDDWKKFVSKEYGFSIETPGEMTLEPAEPGAENEAESVNFSASPVSESDSSIAYKAIFVKVAISEEDIKSESYVNEFLNEMRNSYLESSATMVVKEERIKVDGFPALDIVTKNADGLYLFTRFTLTPKGVATALLVTYASDPANPFTSRFIKSLRILK